MGARFQVVWFVLRVRHSSGLRLLRANGASRVAARHRRMRWILEGRKQLSFRILNTCFVAVMLSSCTASTTSIPEEETENKQFVEASVLLEPWLRAIDGLSLVASRVANQTKRCALDFERGLDLATGTIKTVWQGKSCTTIERANKVDSTTGSLYARVSCDVTGSESLAPGCSDQSVARPLLTQLVVPATLSSHKIFCESNKPTKLEFSATSRDCRTYPYAPLE